MEADTKAMRSTTVKKREKAQMDIKKVKGTALPTLMVRFGRRSASATESEGSNHGIDVYISDSIQTFRQKLEDACERETRHWEGVTGDESSPQASKYRGIKLGHSHLVMAFVPSAKVNSLFQQGMTTSPEYNAEYYKALDDPSCWQPLNSMYTFNHYRQFGFGKKDAQAKGTPVTLRVVEATESYKVRNLRYREFEKELNREYFEDTNTKEGVFGHAKYIHKDDGGSSEWRPGIISPIACEADGSCYKVDWMFKPSGSTGQASQEKRSKQTVLLAPRCPAFDDGMTELHKELLAQVPVLRRGGKTDWEIEEMLNGLLDTKWEKLMEERKQSSGNAVEDEIHKPSHITVDIIKLYMQRMQDQEAKALNMTQTTEQVSSLK